MLKESDSAVVKQWLDTALQGGAVKPVDLARHCNVRPQAVSGWRRTGRISKSNLAKAAELLGSLPDFSARSAPSGLSPIAAASKATATEPPAAYAAPRWPFATVDLLKLSALDAGDLEILAATLLATADRLGVDIRRSKQHAA